MPRSRRSGGVLRASVRMRARVPSSRCRWRGPDPSGTRAPLAATTSSPTRSPVRTWCSARAAAARTVRSSVLARPSIPPETPMSRRASTRSQTPASCSARVVTTCSSPVRNETGQLIRLRRSPVAKGRIPSNSVPLPTRRERCRPTRPSGCGTSARVSYGAVLGSTTRLVSGRCTGPQRQPAHGLVSATRSAPTARRPQRRGLKAMVGSPSSAREPTVPYVGEAATWAARAATRVTCSTPARSSTSRRDVAPCPSCRRRWSRRAATCGLRRGRPASPVAARTTNGAPSTASTSWPSTIPRLTPPSPSRQARTSAGVGRQEVTGGRPGAPPACAASRPRPARSRRPASRTPPSSRGPA